jgi:hypothetical protein
MSGPILFKECPVCNTIFHKSKTVSKDDWEFVGFCCDKCRNVFRSGHVPRNPLERLYLRTVLAPGGCRLFEGDIRNGFGSAVFEHEKDLVHRVAYKIAYGDIPGYREIIQTCGNGRCINPEHLGVTI